jgi:hypothetical protein
VIALSLFQKVKIMSNNFDSIKNPVAGAQAAADNLKQKTAELKQKLINLGVGGLAIVIGSVLISFVIGSWWSFVPVCIVVGAVIGSPAGQSYAYGLAAMTLLWSTYAMIINSANGGVLTSKIGELLGGAVSGTQLIYVTGLLGGIVGGFATMLGATFRDLLRKEPA